MNIYIGADHQGIEHEKKITEYLTNKGYHVIPTSIPHSPTDDYPDFAYDVCRNVIKDNNSLGILICGSGIGISIAANKVKNIRCAIVADNEDAYTAKNHNGANVIALSAKNDFEKIYSFIDTFLSAPEPSEERHIRRINKITAIESGSYEY